MRTPFTLLLLFAAGLQAQTFNQWVDDRIVAVLDKQQVGENGKGSERQRESPSTDPRSTSLVDKSSATDFFSVAANLTPVTSAISRLLPAGTTGSATDSGAQGSGTATATLYALMSGLAGVKPTDPTFYKDHVDARRLSFTIGTAASQLATDNTDKPATVAGAKFLIVNKRELYTEDNLKAIREVQRRLSAATAARAILKPRIQEMMFEALQPSGVKPDGTYDTTALTAFLLAAFTATEFPNTLRALPPETLKRIEDYMDSSMTPFSALRTTLESTYDQIRKGGQMALGYTATVRKDAGNNYHRAEFIYDYGISDRITWTLNASGDYTDRKASFDSRGGRLATEFQGDLTKANSAWGRFPLRLSFSGEAKWLTKQKPQYTFQTRISIPISAGVDLPIVYRYANRIELIDQTGSEVRLGLSIDLARIAAALQ